MYLKRLELQGFKSFASRTTFEFGPGITAIIGPNGSGKSNLSDAIRWALGEQSSRLLRTRKLEDVIFGGSVGRAQMGLAEVSITLDNSDHRLPLDFEEVVITRRIYRSGESEYLLNRQPTRLRDITEVLLHAGLSASGYAFIGQGQIDQMLSLRPEERRLLIEDAADVRRYRLRLEEAQDKLAATRENLDRVQLLVQEIEPRLEQLARQADQAAEYSRLTHQLAHALRAWYEARWQEAHEALVLAQAEYEQQGEMLRAAQKEFADSLERVRALDRAVEDRRRALSEQQQQRAALADQLRAIDQALALDRERVRMQTARRDEIGRELAALEAERQLQPLEVVEHDREHALAEQQAAAQARLNEERYRLAQLEQEFVAKRRQVEEAERRLASARSRVGHLQSRLDRLQATVQQLQEMDDEAARTRQELLRRLKALALEYRQQWLKARELAEEEAAFKQEVALLTERVERGRDELQRMEEEHRRVETELELLRDRLEALKRLHTGYDGFEAGVRAILQAAGLVEDAPPGEQQLRGIHGVVTQLLTVPEGLERAIAAALGEALQAVVVNRLEEAEAAVQMLLNCQAGRAVLYPLDMVRPTPPLNLMRERGVIGVASMLVHCERTYRPLIDLLLGRVIVVEDLATAHRVLSRGLGSVVTLDGILLRPTGAVSGGATAVVSETFARERELETLPQQITRLEQQVQTLSHRLQVKRQAQLADEESMRRLRALEAQFRALDDDLRETWVRHQGQLAAIASALRWARQHGHAQQAEAARTASEITRLGPELEAAQEQVGLLLAEAEAARSQFHQTQLQREAALEEVATLRAQIASLEADLKPLARLRQQVEAAVARLETHLASRREQYTALAHELEALQHRIAENEHERRRCLAHLQELETTLEPGLAELGHLESRQRDLTAEITAIQSQVALRERKYLEAEVAVDRCRGELARLQAESEREGLALEEGKVREAGIAAPLNTTAATARPRPIAGGMDARAIQTEIAQLRAQIRALGPVNAQAPHDYAESKERYDFLTGQLRDLEEAETSFYQAIEALQRLIRDRFRVAFREASERFGRYFATLFGGGAARLALTEPEDYAASGVEIMAQPPGKRLGTLTLLSGGERSLTAVALLLALMETNPSPFCVLDEVDAALDEANVARFAAALSTLAERTQFIIITHNRKTIEAADHIYGVSMGRDGISNVLSLRLADLAPA